GRRAGRDLPVEGADGRVPAAGRDGRTGGDLRGLPEPGPAADALPRALVHGEPAGVRGRAREPLAPGRGVRAAPRGDRGGAPPAPGAPGGAPEGEESPDPRDRGRVRPGGRRGLPEPDRTGAPGLRARGRRAAPPARERRLPAAAVLYDAGGDR